jgi:hypothetical protein
MYDFIFIPHFCCGDGNSITLTYCNTQQDAHREDICDRLQRPCYLSKVDHDKKIRSRKQETDIGKYSFVNRIVQL